MTPSTQLFELIQALTKAEKRSFKLMCSSQGEVDSKIIVRLFDKLEGMKTYDEKLVKYFFRNERFIEQLTSTKNYLYNLILRSLNRSAENKSQERTIESMIQVIPVLYQKKLFTQIVPLIKKIKKQAIENELYLFLFESLSWEENIINHLSGYKNAMFRFNEIKKEKEDALVKIGNRATYQNLRVQVFGLVKDERYGRSRLIFNKEEKGVFSVISNEPPTSLRSKCDMHYSLGILFFYKKDFAKSYAEFKTLLAILDKTDFLKKDSSNYNYLYAAQNCLATAIHLALYDDFVRNLFANLKEEYKNHIANYLLLLRLELAVLVKAARFDQAIYLIEHNQNAIKHIDKQEDLILADFLFGAVQAYFWKGDYKQTIKWINKITTFKQKVFPSEIYFITRLIEILVHIELQNHSLAISFLGSLKRQLDKGDQKQFTEKVIINSLSNYIQNNDHKKQILILKNLQSKLDQPKMKKGTVNLQNNFNFSLWLTKAIKAN